MDAVDVSLRRLELARRGVFSRNAFRGSDLAFRDRYFRAHGQGFAIDPAIRDRVRFLQGSILDPGLLAGEPRYDVVFCRNLLIYLDQPSRLRAMATLDRLLATDGRLVVGHADRVELERERLGAHPRRRAPGVHVSQGDGTAAGAGRPGPPRTATAMDLHERRAAHGPGAGRASRSCRPPHGHTGDGSGSWRAPITGGSPTGKRSGRGLHRQPARAGRGAGQSRPA